MEKEIDITCAKHGAENNNLRVTYRLLAKGANVFEINISDSKFNQTEMEEALLKKLNVKKMPEVIRVIGKPK